MNETLNHYDEIILSAYGGTDDTVRAEFMAATLESCPVGLSICDATKPNPPFLYVNPAFTGITGYFLHDVAGKGFDLLCGEETCPETLEHVATALESYQPVDVDIVHYRKDGTPFWCELRVTPIVREGRTVALIGVHTDITERRLHLLEDQRRRKLLALGQLSGGVAHEINNLLQPILTYADLVRTEVKDQFPAAARRLERVLACTEKARDIVRAILRFARGEATEVTSLDLHDTLTEAIGFVRTLLPKTVVITVTGLEADLGVARINTTELTQVFSNLLTNASHAMDGHGTAGIAVTRRNLRRRQASILGLTPGTYCVIAITDTGHGMDAATQSRLFEPFFTTKAVGQGTGLGLSMVYGILQAWHGAISVVSTPGRGTTFTLFIPIISDVS